MIVIPKKFMRVHYNSESYPGNAFDFKLGANCQHYCYEFLRHFNYEIGDLRSSNLWDDQEFTQKVKNMKPFDLVLVHSQKQSYGAHVGICIDENRNILHLSKENDIPLIQALDEIMVNEKYKYLIGVKRPIKKAPQM